MYFQQNNHANVLFHGRYNVSKNDTILPQLFIAAYEQIFLFKNCLRQARTVVIVCCTNYWRSFRSNGCKLGHSQLFREANHFIIMLYHFFIRSL